MASEQLVAIQPFSEEFRDIIKDTKTKKTFSTGDGIMLINQHKFNEELPVNTIIFLFLQ